jgi:hypothetical protein
MKLPSNHKQTDGSPQCERAGSYATFYDAKSSSLSF